MQPVVFEQVFGDCVDERQLVISTEWNKHHTPSNCAYLAAVSIIASSPAILDQAIDAAKNRNSTILSLLIVDQEIAIRGERLTVMVLKEFGNSTEIMIPELCGLNRFWVRSVDLQPIYFDTSQVAQPTPGPADTAPRAELVKPSSRAQKSRKPQSD